MNKAGMRSYSRWAWIIGLLVSLGVYAVLAAAQEAPVKKAAPAKEAPPAAAKQPPPVAANYSKKGADTCLKCHDEDNAYPVMPLFRTKHAAMGDPRSPMAHLQCETCHGPGRQHAKLKKKDDTADAPMRFGRRTPGTTAERNAVCLDCHQGHARLAWQGSRHEANDVACVDCHRVHVHKDPVLQRKAQPGVCFQCHQRQRAQIHRASSHPLRRGQMSCSDCHNPHDAFGDKHLAKFTVNETCYACHAEKRGPFLWPHAPVVEDCTQCHAPHGSNHPALLTKRPPQLCQQCHSQAGHPSLALDGAAVSDNFANRFVLIRGCLNCHGKVHGSNHPSGVKLMR